MMIICLLIFDYSGKGSYQIKVIQVHSAKMILVDPKYEIIFDTL